MKRFWMLLFVLVLLLPAMSWAGSIKCSRYQIHVEGAQNVIPGHDYKEVLDMHKVDQSSGYDGRWKVDRIVQITKYPSSGLPTIHVPTRVKFPNGQWMTCNAIAVNNVTVMDCSGGEMYLDVSNNRIGSKKTNLWQGTIQGRKVTYRFDPNNPLSPVLTGELREPGGSHMNFSITASAGDKYTFDDDTIGALEMEFTAHVSPSQYEQDVEWDVPEIEGSTLTMDPPSGKGPHLIVRYEGLPQSNSQFGPKTIKATVNLGSCRAEDSKTVKIFYMRDAKNNPDGSVPNWYYYWKQTPAAKPKGQSVPITYGGNGCAGHDMPAQYVPGHSSSSISVCDLAGLGSDFALTYPRLTLKTPYFKGTTTTKHIDTFASAIRHEYEHWQITLKHRTNHGGPGITAQDTDNDGLPDTAEPQYGFDPLKKLTHLANHPVVKKVEEDENWLAYMAMLDIKIGSLDKYDWARPGKQWP